MEDSFWREFVNDGCEILELDKLWIPARIWAR
jgi:hypothetical protein